MVQWLLLLLVDWPICWNERSVTWQLALDHWYDINNNNNNNNNNNLLCLSQEILILDEADRLLDLGFETT